MSEQEQAPLWTDSHCHLAMADFDPDREEVIRRAGEARVTRLVVVGTTPADWAPASAIAASRGFPCTAGLHPHEASLWGAEVGGQLGEALRHPAAAAVGETGLDFHYDLSPRADQLRAFESQLALASDLGLPVVVHSREAFGETASILRDFAPPLRGVLHCFTYGPREAEAFLDMGLYVSFSGIVTFPKAPLVRDAARVTPLDRMLVETDAPYLAPPPHRGKRCEPAHVALVGRFLAQFLGIEEAEFARRTSENAVRLFGGRPMREGVMRG